MGNSSAIVAAVNSGVQVVCSECRSAPVLESKGDHAQCPNCGRVWIAKAKGEE